MSETKRIRVTQLVSANGHKPGQKETLIGLGLNKIRKSRDHNDTAEVRGMVKKVAHLVKIEDLA